jgi:tRNA nucleotidyltransferase/poly(A) polymerase
MDLKEILSTISNIAEQQGTTAFICGGVPRDKVLNKPNSIEDIDITTGDNKVHYLAKEVSIKLKGPTTSYKLLDDGHAQVFVDKLKLDFSSNFNIPKVKPLLIKAGLKNPTDMQAELYSRDFTCNALLMSLDLKTITDPTGLSLQDIKAKTLRTCLPASITLGYDNKRIVRVLYLSSKLGFSVDKEIVNWIKKNPQLIKNCSTQYLTKKLLKAISYDKSNTVKLLDEMGLWKYIPPLKEFGTDLTKNPGRI